MADDELRKGQRGAVGCVDLLIYRPVEEEEALTASRLIIQVLFSPPGYGFTTSPLLFRDSVGLHDVARREVLPRHVQKWQMRKLSKTKLEVTQSGSYRVDPAQQCQRMGNRR